MIIHPAPAPVSFIHEDKLPAVEAASAAYLSFMPEYFKDKVYLFNSIRKKVSEKLLVDIHQIYVCGSTQFGFSYIKNKEFIPGESDLDLAIISASLFSRYYGAAIEATNGFTDLRKFKSNEQANLFFTGISRHGMIRPNSLPRGYGGLSL